MEKWLSWGYVGTLLKKFLLKHQKLGQLFYLSKNEIWGIKLAKRRLFCSEILLVRSLNTTSKSNLVVEILSDKHLVFSVQALKTKNALLRLTSFLVFFYVCFYFFTPPPFFGAGTYPVLLCRPDAMTAKWSEWSLAWYWGAIRIICWCYHCAGTGGFSDDCSNFNELKICKSFHRFKIPRYEKFHSIPSYHWISTNIVSSVNWVALW